jgi:hypothetical protein
MKKLLHLRRNNDATIISAKKRKEPIKPKPQHKEPIVPRLLLKKS